jgi:osmotically inducible protein OsmC
MDRKATAVWKGSLKEGKGSLTAPSGAFIDLPYSFRMRFENEPGTNPEELVAAAHAGCYAMALSGNLENAGFVPNEIYATATVTLDMVDGAPTVTKSHLEVEASVPGIPNEQFDEIAQQTKDGCPVSRLLTAELSVTAKLKS